jgi:lantibiotic modifying enzyme
MQLNQQELATIVQKAQSLWERLEGDIVPAPTHDPQVETKIAARLQQWRDIVAEGDEELFEKRLAYDRLDRETVRRLLGNGTMAGAAALPDWTTLLNAILQHTTEFPLAELEADGAGQYPFLDQDAPIPFEEVFVPCILVARARLMAACGDRYGLLSAPAHAAFERLLVQRLSAISCRVLEVEFATFIACLQLEGISYQSVKAAVTSRTQYVRFVKTLYAGELASLFQEYSRHYRG